jgi:hypothetical protein
MSQLHCCYSTRRSRHRGIQGIGLGAAIERASETKLAVAVGLPTPRRPPQLLGGPSPAAAVDLARMPFWPPPRLPPASGGGGQRSYAKKGGLCGYLSPAFSLLLPHHALPKLPSADGAPWLATRTMSLSDLATSTRSGPGRALQPILCSSRSVTRRAPATGPSGGRRASRWRRIRPPLLAPTLDPRATGVCATGASSNGAGESSAIWGCRHHSNN